MKGRVAFHCWRPFQLFTIINLVMQDRLCEGRVCDLYIQCNDYLYKYKDNIESSGLFEKVVWYKEHDCANPWLRVEVRINNIFPLCELKSGVVKKNDYRHTKNTKYSYIFSSGWNPFFVAFDLVHKEAKCIHFEDGIAGYLNINYESRVLKKKDKIEHNMLKLIGRGVYSVKIAAFLVYEPKFVNKEIHLAYKGRKIPKLTAEVFDKEIEVFTDGDGKRGKTNLKGKTIFLTPIPFKNKENINSPEKDPIVKLLVKYKEGMVVRRHPTDIHVDYGKLGIIPEPRNEYIWEIAVGDGIDSRTVIIAEFSSGQLTPYLLYKKYPTLVFLYRYTQAADKRSVERLDEFVNKMKKVYKGEIYLPETFEEVDEVIGKFSKRKACQKIATLFTKE